MRTVNFPRRNFLSSVSVMFVRRKLYDTGNFIVHSATAVYTFLGHLYYNDVQLYCRNIWPETSQM